jgi:hypothetical protein
VEKEERNVVTSLTSLSVIEAAKKPSRFYMAIKVHVVKAV